MKAAVILTFLGSLLSCDATYYGRYAGKYVVGGLGYGVPGLGYKGLPLAVPKPIYAYGLPKASYTHLGLLKPTYTLPYYMNGLLYDGGLPPALPVPPLNPGYGGYFTKGLISSPVIRYGYVPPVPVYGKYGYPLKKR
ncbi:shematrin-like protein 1 [Stegodyphus dumicola]|uniref:shematrin-like protein 1 n=1 Tax=Stegodyphus dumicola TaxID=202533 RepID=UPI0015A9111F|nr:shematrin-like protein 1 [Stegodyphus dumicola]